MATSLMCRIFGHSFTAPQYEKNPDSCQLVITCGRCGRKESQGTFDHQYKEWTFVAPDSCEQVRECSQCGYQARRVRHSSKEWVVSASDPCKSIQKCTRCGAQLHKSYQHDFGEWSIGADCRLTRTCRRCGCSGASPDFQHGELTWVKHPTNPCALIQVCKRCGARVGNMKEDHEYTVVEDREESHFNQYYEEWVDTAITVLVCKICGKRVENRMRLSPRGDWETDEFHL